MGDDKKKAKKKKEKKKKKGAKEEEPATESRQAKEASATSRAPARADPKLTSVAARLRVHLKETSAEQRLARCVQKLLEQRSSLESLPNAHSTFATSMSLSLSNSSAAGGPSIWRESRLHVTQHSALDQHLADSELGAVWRALTR